MLFNFRIRHLREKRDIAQKELAKYLKISESTYSNYESEKYIFPIKTINELCNYFNVSLDYLFGFTNNLCYGNSKSDIDVDIVATRLKEFRKENGLTQIDLAEFLKVVKGTIGNYESSRALIATPFLYEICKKYKISADYLLGKIDNPKYLK